MPRFGDALRSVRHPSVANESLGLTADLQYRGAMTSVPGAFVSAAERWASGRGSAADAAAVAAVSLNVPLPRAYDAEAMGFDLTTRLPAPHDLPAYVEARNGARAAAHAEQEYAARDAVLRAATAVEPSSAVARDFERGAGTGAVAGGRDFIRAALQCGDASWRVEPEELFPAGGAAFVDTFRAEGAQAAIDPESDEIVFTWTPDTRPFKLVKTYFALAAVTGEALPAGKVEQGLAQAPLPSRAAGLFCDVFGRLGTLSAILRRRRKRSMRARNQRR